MLIAGTAMVAATVVLFSIMFALYAAAGAFATAGGVIAIILTWELAVERPRRQARVAQALATPSRSPEDIPLQTGDPAPPTGARNCRDRWAALSGQPPRRWRRS